MNRRTFLASSLMAIPAIALADRRSALSNQRVPAAGGGGGLSSGLVLLWKMDESSGNRVATIGGLDLSENGSIPSATGPANITPAADFDGGGEYLYHADDTALREGDFDSHWVIWLKIPNNAGTYMLVAKDNASSRGMICYRNNATLHFGGPDATGGSVDFAYGSAISHSTWHMIDFGYDKSGGVWFLNVDAGTRVTSSQTHPQTGQTAQFRVNAREYTSFEGYDVGSQKCYLMRWNRILSGSELTQLYNSGNGLAYPF
jgi:hypothetical protein